MPEGHELKQVNTPSAPANNIEVTSYLAGCFVAGLGLPPAFFLDEKLTGPNQRAVNGKAQRKFDRRKQVSARLGRSAWQRVIASGIDSGALPSVDGWARCDFIGPSKITIDAGREMAQEREDVARGLMTRRDHYGNRGRSWRRETDQVFEEIDYILDRAQGGRRRARNSHRNCHGELRFGVGKRRVRGGQEKLKLTFRTLVTMLNASDDAGGAGADDRGAGRPRRSSRGSCSRRPPNPSPGARSGKRSRPKATVENGIGILEITGILAYRPDIGSLFFDGFEDSAEVLGAFRRLESNPEVDAILLNINSPGGFSVGGPEIADAIRGSSKPTVTWSGGMCCSLAYWIG